MGNSLKIGWLSHHVEGIAPLIGLLDAKAPIAAIITLKDDLLKKRSGAADFGQIAQQHSIPIHHIANVNSDEALEIFRDLALDALFVIGWSQILRPNALDCFPLGCFGAHASLLPANRGSAPINWALIKGERITGNTLMRLSADVDAGDIIAQRTFAISNHDNVATLYAKVADTNLDMLLSLTRELGETDHVVGQRQCAADEALLPRRRPEHGVIDWRWNAPKLYNFVRALTRPYPGAIGRIDGKTYKIWHLSPLPIHAGMAGPGQILGSVPSDLPGQSGLAVACGSGAVLLHEIEDENGRSIADRSLAAIFDEGMAWTLEENSLDIG